MRVVSCHGCGGGGDMRTAYLAQCLKTCPLEHHREAVGAVEERQGDGHVGRGGQGDLGLDGGRREPAGRGGVFEQRFGAFLVPRRLRVLHVTQAT